MYLLFLLVYSGNQTQVKPGARASAAATAWISSKDGAAAAVAELVVAATKPAAVRSLAETAVRLPE